MLLKNLEEKRREERKGEKRSVRREEKEIEVKRREHRVESIKINIIELHSCVVQKIKYKLV
jgi:hypothetical protein